MGHRDGSPDPLSNKKRDGSRNPLQTHEVPCHTLRSRVKVCGLKFQLTSLEIAEVTGKPHNDVLKAIRKMEQAWVNVTQGNFSLRRKAGRFSQSKIS